ncbi:NAD-dependent epimerase/dehydratase family protein [Streptomyces sp. NBC_01754]|uniref:NAD-dependent epimerase/dehydratase family protein n=1 Tax=Streptomyces sp. NBC_01754 TaxID=2975930 RepID=UPI002DDB723C|nr:NAD-dependent epimerase/dehydratase family protein [Streptomyces sp. NBC_01754]WSC92596.1 NAD-dependent epimerase/dehydratase family protein [Streptomyces sp. NBC_01754]
MKILVLGGTWFLGWAVAQTALDRGWEVTVFHRGRSGTAPEGARTVHGDRTVVADLVRLAGEGPWDAVVDTSASEMAPRDVLSGARALEPVAGRYVYVSTVNAYRGWPDEPLSEDSEVLDGPPDADSDFGRLPEGWDGPDWYYGRQKAGAERAATTTFGDDRAVVLRPGVILGPGEYVGRLPWWLNRAARGGSMLAPGAADKGIQPIDVRDVAAFALDRAAADRGGAYNCVAPMGRNTMEDLLAFCLLATGGDAQLAWAPDKLLMDHGVKQWTELPLWRTHAGVWRIESTRAQAAGLVCRPLADTVADTWAWLRGGGMPVEHPRWAEHGITPEKEAVVLAALGR